MPTSIAAYEFVPVTEPSALATQVAGWAGSRGLLGTVIVAGEGINLFLAGTQQAVDGFLVDLRADPRFAGIRVKSGHSETPPFARLKVKVKPEIISFRRAAVAPATAGRAPVVSPSELARWITQGSDDEGHPVVLLDTRNREEVAHGSFVGARALAIDDFSAFPGAVDAERDALAGATVIGFCTGGIRCEKAMAWMQDAGFERVRQLDGGILGYFEAVGGLGYEGNCFVFDARVAVDPGLRPVNEVGTAGNGVDRAAA